MARLTKEIPIDDKKITVKEFTVAEIKRLWKELTAVGVPENFSGFALSESALSLWTIAIDGLSIDEMDNLTPTNLKQVYDAFIEVNKVFFDLASQIEGENTVLQGFRLAIMEALRWSIVETLRKQFAVSLKKDTPTSGTTDIVSS